MAEVNLRVAAKAVIMNDKHQILILREAGYDEGTQTHLYGLVGGRINADESFFDGLRREVREETGLTEIDVVKPLFVGEWYPTIKGVKNHIVVMFMLCEAHDDNVKLSEEHDNFVWLSRADCAKYRFMEPDNEVIDLAFKEKK